jgi:hypothetical protein
VLNLNYGNLLIEATKLLLVKQINALAGSNFGVHSKVKQNKNILATIEKQLRCAVGAKLRC